MHDLLRCYARELSAAVDGGEEQQAALTRLFDHYLHAAATAMDTLYPAERHRRPRIPRPDTPVPPLADPAAARDWLDRERPALVAAAGHTAAHGWPSHATRLAAILSAYLRNGDHIPEVLTVFSHALGAARRTGDRAADATALNDMGEVDWEQGRPRQAADRHRQALALFRVTCDRAGEAYALGSLGFAEKELGRYEQAACHQQDAVAIFRDLGDRFGEARALGVLGLARLRQGRCREAVGYHKHSLNLSREIGDRDGEAGKAREHHATALRRASEAGAPLEQARAHSGLARACQADGDSLQARHHWQEALTRYAAIGAPKADEIRARLAMTGDDGDDDHQPAKEDRGTTASSSRDTPFRPGHR